MCCNYRAGCLNVPPCINESSTVLSCVHSAFILVIATIKSIRLVTDHSAVMFSCCKADIMIGAAKQATKPVPMKAASTIHEGLLRANDPDMPETALVRGWSLLHNESIIVVYNISSRTFYMRDILVPIWKVTRCQPAVAVMAATMGVLQSANGRLCFCERRNTPRKLEGRCRSLKTPGLVRRSTEEHIFHIIGWQA